MPQTIRQEDFDFLVNLDAHIGRGLPAYLFAEAQDINPSTVTRTLDRFGLKAKRAVGLVDKRSGETFGDLLGQNAFQLIADAAEAVTA